MADDDAMEARVTAICRNIVPCVAGALVGDGSVALHSVLAGLYWQALRDAESEAERQDMVLRIVRMFATSLEDAGVAETEVMQARDALRADAKANLN